MKKITLLFALLITSIGFSQELVTNGDFESGATGWSGNAVNVVTQAGNKFNEANVAAAGNPWDANLSYVLPLTPNVTYVLKFDAWSDRSRTIVAGVGLNHDPWTNVTQTPALSTTTQTFTYNFVAPANSDADSRIIFDMGAQIGYVGIDNVSLKVFVADPLKDATLSDLKVDGATVTGFSALTTTYSVAKPTGTTTVPQITAASTTQTSPATAVITQATAIPGSASVLVTSKDGSTTKTYTVNYITSGPSASAPTPPARPSADVISLYSNAYTNVASNFDAGWCGANSVQEVMIAGNGMMAWKGNACQGIDLNTGINASSFTRLHVDVYIEAGTDLTSSVFNLKFVQQPGGGALELNFNIASTPALVAGSWLSIDVPVNLTTFTGFKEFGITSPNLNNKLWYDNLYVHKGTVLGVTDFKLANINMYPNPVSNELNISAENTIQNVAVYNLLGQEVLSSNPNATSAKLQTSGLSKGVYLVKATIDGNVSSSKFIKE